MKKFTKIIIHILLTASLLGVASYGLSYEDLLEARKSLETYLDLEQQHKWGESYEYLSEQGKEFEFNKAKCLNDQIELLHILGMPGLKFFSETALSQKEFIVAVTDNALEMTGNPLKRATVTIENFASADNQFIAKVLIFSTDVLDRSIYHIYKEGGEWKVSMDPQEVQNFIDRNNKLFDELVRRKIEEAILSEKGMM